MLPRHDNLTRLQRALEVTCLSAAVGLLVANLVRLAAGTLLSGQIVLAAVSGALLADFVSGMIHWLADTWGSETMPILGRRFLRPFRVHHVNPDDFLRRNFIDTNGDVSMILLPCLAVALFLPLEARWGEMLVVLLVSFCAVGLPTNQVHQWAHMPNPPSPIAWLQQRGVILSREAHQRHHRAPYVENYCIATGWCNRLLCHVGFYRRLERAVTWLTGVRPRGDDAAFQADLKSISQDAVLPEAR